MAEAIVNAQMSNQWQAFSAGTRPSGFVHPNAITVLSELGIKHEGFSKHADIFREDSFDLVITLCDSAAEECPLWLGQGRRFHVGFPDPAKAVGTQSEVLAVFRQVRDDIASKIPAFLNQFT